MLLDDICELIYLLRSPHRFTNTGGLQEFPLLSLYSLLDYSTSHLNDCIQCSREFYRNCKLYTTAKCVTGHLNLEKYCLSIGDIMQLCSAIVYSFVDCITIQLINVKHIWVSYHIWLLNIAYPCGSLT